MQKNLKNHNNHDKNPNKSKYQCHHKAECGGTKSKLSTGNSAAVTKGKRVAFVTEKYDFYECLS